MDPSLGDQAFLDYVILNTVNGLSIPALCKDIYGWSRQVETSSAKVVYRLSVVFSSAAQDGRSPTVVMLTRDEADDDEGYIRR